MSHEKALERSIEGMSAQVGDQDAALLELCRTLARQMDAVAEPSTRLTAAYLSALKDLGRISGKRPHKSTGRSRLDELRARREERLNLTTDGPFDYQAI